MNEIQIREQLIKELAKKHPHNTEFLAELPIANFSRRIDLVMANGSLSGFEIKSEQDSLRRLAGQLETYTQYFENVTVVCATKHLTNVMKMTSSRIGVWEFDGEKLIEHQAPIYQPLSKLNWLSFLNVSGLKVLLKAYHLKVTGLKDELIERALSLKEDEIREFLLTYLKKQFSQVRSDRKAIKLRQQEKHIESLKLILNKVDTTSNEEGFITLPSGLKVRPILRQ
ncbi:sce7726 family protein [Gallibacterium genomosp. 1]|uniref:sce7726 family protein n=1 Tax=Gallibacterium genomosp. 1 TaxID=155515 RepID=UPI00080264CB|nr:sce7726 family protein [Gallibacterium genomosp. 1]